MKAKTRKTLGYVLLTIISLPIIALWVWMIMDMNWYYFCGLMTVFAFVGLTGFGLYLIRDKA